MRSPLPSDPVAAVLDPARIGFEPALMADAWFQLMEARGRHVGRDQMCRLVPRHDIRRTPAAVIEAQKRGSRSLTDMVCDTLPAIHAAMARRGLSPRDPRPGGDAA